MRCFCALVALTAACSMPLPPQKDRDLAVAAPEEDMASAPDLAPVCTPECPAESTTRCTGGKLQTCVLRDGCLRWDTARDCDAGQLCCAGSCIPADAQNCYACGTACSGPTPVCSATLQRCVCTEEACAPSHRDCDASAGMCVACVDPAVPESRGDFYVDGSTPLTPTGSMGCPYRTISDAVAVAGTSSAGTRTVHIAAGTYSTESFPITLRGNLSLVGAGAGATIIEGTAAIDHSAAGGALNVSTFATVLIGDAAATAGLRDLTVRAPVSDPTANHYGILCDQGNAPQTITNPPAAMPAPNAVLSGLAVGPGFDYGVAVTNSTVPAASGCNLRLEKSTVSGNFNGVWVVGCGTGGPGGIVSAQIDGNTITGNTKPSNSGFGTVVWDCSSPVAITNNSYSGNDSGLALAQHGRVDVNIPVPGYITVENNVFRNLTNVGLIMGAAVLVERLTSNRFSNISTPAGAGSPGIAVVLDGSSTTYRPQIKKARNNVFIGNDIGVVFRGATAIAPDPDGFDTDFGTAADPGNNVFRCNSTASGSALTGYDVLVSTSGSGILRFAGNQWDSAAPRVAASGVNGVEVVESGAPAPSVALDNATAAAAMCPADRTP